MYVWFAGNTQPGTQLHGKDGIVDCMTLPIKRPIQKAENDESVEFFLKFQLIFFFVLGPRTPTHR